MSYVTVALTYAVVGLASATFVYYIVGRPVLGRFIGALVVGLIGAVLGALAGQLFGDVLQRLADFNGVNLFAASSVSLLCVWMLSKARRHR